MSAARIEEVIGEHVLLRRRGVNMIGLCPFHNEKTPSFTVSPAKGMFKCFGCQKAGDVVKFLMEYEHYSYPEALRYLAKKYQIEIREEEETPEMIREQNEKETLFLLNQFALDFFTRSLHDTDEGKSIAMGYLKERGIRDDLIRKFQLGYNPDPWDAFSSHAVKEGYKEEYLVKIGLSIKKEERLYDRFHSRVIFPVHSTSGRIIGFGGRILTSDKNRPKYVNSPESEIYTKSKTLYGIFFAKNPIISKDNCFLVEGYTDVISLFQAGIENVVASSGTSLTEDQIRMIQRFTKNVTILYDGDPAGIKASFRGIDMILEKGLNVRIVLFPDGEDPDSFARKNHPDEVIKFITGNSVNFITFKTHLLLNDVHGDPIKKASLVKEIVSSIGLIPDGITRSVYIRECSGLMSVPEQVLMNEVRKALRNRIMKSLPETEKPEDAGWQDTTVDIPEPAEFDPYSSEHQEKEIIRLLLRYGGEVIRIPAGESENVSEEVAVRLADFIVHDVLTDEVSFENPTYAKIFSEYVTALENEPEVRSNWFTSHAEPEIARTAIDLIFTPHELSENWEKNNIFVDPEEKRLRKIIFSALLSLKARKIDKMISETQKRIMTAPEQEEISALLMRLKELKSRSVMINQELGRIVTR
jgi:DNA primase